MAESADDPGKSRSELLDADFLKKIFFEVSNFRPRYFAPKTLNFFSGFQTLTPSGSRVKIDQKPKMTKTSNIGPKESIQTINDKIPAKKFFRLFFIEQFFNFDLFTQ